MGREEFGRRFGISILRLIGEQGSHATLKLARNVDHKRRRNVGIGRRVHDFEWPVWRNILFETPKAGEKTSLIPNLRSTVVIRVPACPIRENDYTRPKAPHHPRQRHSS